MIKMYCDMDGVLTEFINHYKQTVGTDFEEVRKLNKKESYKIINGLSLDWWRTMPWKQDGKELWYYLRTRYINLHILSAPTSDKEKKCHKGKMLWLKDNNILDQIGVERCILAQDKHKQVQQGVKCILIDDTVNKIEKWRGAGGIGILHTSTKQTIEELEKL